MVSTQPLTTHIVYTLRRESRLRSRWLEVGHARINNDGTSVHQVFLDRLPVGGFSGRLFLSPIGTKPPFQHIGILSLEFHVDKLSRPLL